MKKFNFEAQLVNNFMEALIKSLHTKLGVRAFLFVPGSIALRALDLRLSLQYLIILTLRQLTLNL